MLNFRIFITILFSFAFITASYSQTTYINPYIGANISSGKLKENTNLIYRTSMIQGLSVEKEYNIISFHLGLYNIQRGGVYFPNFTLENGESIKSYNILELNNIGIPFKIGFQNAIRRLKWSLKFNVIPEFNYKAQERIYELNATTRTVDVKANIKNFNLMMGAEAEISKQISKRLIIAGSVAYNYDLPSLFIDQKTPVLDLISYGIPFNIGLKYRVNNPS